MRAPPSAPVALGLLTGVNLLNYIDRYIAFGVLPVLLSDLHLSDTRGGLLLTVFMISYSVLCPAAGWAGDRVRRFGLLGVGVLIWSAATFGSGLAPTFGALLVARALIGVGEATYGVVAPSLLSDFYAPQRRTRALSVFYAAIPIGAALGYIAGGQIAHAFGWRWAFFIAGTPGLVLALAFLVLRDPPRGGRDPEPLRKTHAALSLRATLAGLRVRPSYLVNTASQTLYTFTMGGLAGWMPTYFVRERHLSLREADTVFGALLSVAGFLGTLAGGVLGERLAARRRDGHFVMSGWALVLSLPFTALAILSPSPAIFWPAMFVSLTLLFLNTGPLNAAMANVLPPELRARGFALCTMCIHVLGDAISPTLIGIASDRVGLKWPVLASSALLGVAGLVLLLGRRTLARDIEAAA